MTAQSWTRPTPVDFSSVLQPGLMLIDGAVLLTGFKVQYPGSGPLVQHIGAGAMEHGRSEITLPTACAFMWNNSGSWAEPVPGCQASLLAIRLAGDIPVTTR